MANDQELKFKLFAQVFGQQSVKEFQSSLKGVGDTAKNLNSGFNSLKTGLQGLIAGFAIKEVVAFGQSLLDSADNLRDLSQKTGISVKDLSGFKVAAEQSGTNIDQLSGAFSKLNKNLADASTGNRSALSGFQALGVSVKDSSGRVRDTGSVVKDLADKFASFKDGPEKARLAIELFGKSGADIIPLLNGGSEALGRFSGLISDNFADRADQLNDTFSDIKNATLGSLTAGFEKLLPNIQSIVNVFAKTQIVGGGLDEVFLAINETVRLLATGLEGLLTTLVIVGDVIIQSVVVALDFAKTKLIQFKDLVVGTVDALKALGSGNLSGVGQVFENLGKSFQKADKDFQDNTSDRFKALGERTIKRVQESAKNINELLRNSVIFGDGTVDEIQKRIEKETAPGKRKFTAPTPDISGLDQARQGQIDKVKEFITAQKLENDQRRESLDDINKTKLELAQLSEARKFDNEVLKASKGLNEEQKKALQEQAEAIKNERLALIELEDQQKRTWQFGARAALRDYLDTATNVGKQVQDTLGRAFANMEDSLTSFVKTGKADFSKFADDIITDIIRIQVRFAIAQAVTGLSSLFGGFGGGAVAEGAVGQGAALSPFANGGIMTSGGPVPLKAYARGGVASSPQMALFGEGSMPEAFVPLPDGRRIPVALQGSGGGSVSVVVNNYLDGSSDAKSSDSKGRELGGAISQAVQAELIKQKRPGGLLWQGA